MKKRDITIDDLARMVQKEFTGVQQQLKMLEKNDQAIIKKLDGVVYRHEFEELSLRVKELENLLVVNDRKR
mgnify:FL=1